MPVPSQGHCGFHSFPVVDWFCLFIYLWVFLSYCVVLSPPRCQFRGVGQGMK
jgi:hypothetical protein